MYFKSWKTTICGTILCITGIVLFIISRPIEASMSIVTGIGLLSAKDSTVTGTGNSARTENEINQLQQDKKHIIND